MIDWKRTGLAALALLAVATVPAFAQNGNGTLVGSTGGTQRTLSAVRVDEGPTAANWRNSPVWQQAMAITDFVQQEPVEFAPATERTEVRLVYDAEAIYVGAWMYDTDASQIRLGEVRRDANLDQSDSFQIIFDTYRDGQNGFLFGTHPGGIEFDGQVVNEGRGGAGSARQQGGAGGGANVNWDGSWTVSTERDEQGWYAFFRIPFSTLRYGSDALQDWGINFQRSIAHKNEQVFWAPIARQYNLFRVSNAGVVSGLEVPAQRVMTFTPYVLGSAQRIPARHEGFKYPYEFGADAKIGVTQSLMLDMTVNTDFAQVEVDEQQVDLTRFNLLFPEKRPFFLENAGIFAVGDNNSAQLFFSRKIGISERGAPVPIQGGARLTGRAAGLNVGALLIQTDELDGVQSSNRYAVARASREFGNRTQLGAIFTNRTAVGDSDDYGHTYAVDGRVGIGEAFTFNAMAGGTKRPGFTSGQEVIMVNAEYRTRDTRIAPHFEQLGDNFLPEVGFLRRTGFRQGGITLWRYVRVPSVDWLLELRPHTSYDASYKFDGFKETARWHIDSHVVWKNGAQFSPALDWVYEGLEEPFTAAPGVVVQPGNYSGWFWQPVFNTSTRSPVIYRAGLNLGEFVGGTRKGGTASVDFRRGSTLAGRFALEYNDVTLPAGRFDATVAAARLGYSFTPRLFVQTLVQYSTQSDIWSGNLRLGWLDTAGTGLFLVYNERQMVEGIAGPLERSFTVKFTRQFNMAQGIDLLGM